MLIGWEEARKVQQLIFIYFLVSEKCIILSEVKEI